MEGTELLQALLEMHDVQELEKAIESITGLLVLPTSSTMTEKRKFYLMRELILDYHITIEFLMNSLLARYFVPPIQSLNFQEMILSKIEFGEKIKIIRKLKLTTLAKSHWETVEAINTIRNTFAHGYHVDHPKFLYKGKKAKHIFKNSAIIKEFQSDALMIIKEFLKVKIDYRTF